MLVSTLGQISISYTVAAYCLLVSTLCNALCVAGAFGALDSVVNFDFYFVFSLQLATGCLQIPVNQLGARFQVQQKQSQARFRMYAWIAVITFGTLALVLFISIVLVSHRI